jgi:maltose O-acetyltransferase
MNEMLTGVVRVVIRVGWPPIYLLWLRLRVAIWGTFALEYAVANAPPWLAVKILQAYGMEIGKEFDFHGRLQLHGTYRVHGKLKIGSQCHIGPYVTIDLSGPVVLEDRCTVSLNTQILTHQDTGYSPLSLNAYPTRWGKVIIEYGAYIGAGAIILPDVRIGRCSVVAAGAVVREDVPPYTVVAGIPARVIKQLNPAEVELT